MELVNISIEKQINMIINLDESPILKMQRSHRHPISVVLFVRCRLLISLLLLAPDLVHIVHSNSHCSPGTGSIAAVAVVVVDTGSSENCRHRRKRRTSSRYIIDCMPL